jgi:hypothetical protein
MAVTTDAVDGTEDPELDFRALTEYMTVLEDGDHRARAAPDLYTVTTESGSTYLVDAELLACECPDHEYRDRKCKHLRRLEFALGLRAIPEWVNDEAVDPDLGDHVDAVREHDDKATEGDR